MNVPFVVGNSLNVGTASIVKGKARSSKCIIENLHLKTKVAVRVNSIPATAGNDVKISFNHNVSTSGKPTIRKLQLELLNAQRDDDPSFAVEAWGRRFRKMFSPQLGCGDYGGDPRDRGHDEHDDAAQVEQHHGGDDREHCSLE